MPEPRTFARYVYFSFWYDSSPVESAPRAYKFRRVWLERPFPSFFPSPTMALEPYADSLPQVTLLLTDKLTTTISSDDRDALASFVGIFSKVNVSSPFIALPFSPLLNYLFTELLHVPFRPHSPSRRTSVPASHLYAFSCPRPSFPVGCPSTRRLVPPQMHRLCTLPFFYFIIILLIFTCF